MSCFTEASAGFRNLRESREKTAGFRRYCFHTLELAGPHNRNRTREINGDTDDFASPKICDPRYVLLVQNAVFFSCSANAIFLSKFLATGGLL